MKWPSPRRVDFHGETDSRRLLVPMRSPICTALKNSISLSVAMPTGRFRIRFTLDSMSGA